MLGALKSFSNSLLFLFSGKEKHFGISIRNIIGQKPDNLELYKLALCHTSVAKENDLGIRQSNERLEFLGDAVLGMVIAEFLFKKFPFKDEGFLTEIRSRIVNRESLNKLSKKIGLGKMVVYAGGRNNNVTHKSIYGDALEALVGAVYLDKGFKASRKFILKKLLDPHFDIADVINNNLNFKSLLIEWAQKENKELRFEIINEAGSMHSKEFTAQIVISGEALCVGVGFSKKKAEQSAAEKACAELGIK